jgi:hypothetical protein
LPRRSKAPEDWRSPRFFALSGVTGIRASVLDCGGPPPLFPERRGHRWLFINAAAHRAALRTICLSKNWSTFWTINPDNKDFPTVYVCPRSGTEGAANQGVDITASKINEWVRIDRRRKIRADRRHQFFGRVRNIFIFLFVATILVFVFNRHTEIQGLAYAKLNHAVKNSPASDKLRQGAINYEKQVDEITK